MLVPPQSRNSVPSQNFLSRTVSCLRKKRPITLGRESCEEIFIGCKFLLVVGQSQLGCVFFHGSRRLRLGRERRDVSPLIAKSLFLVAPYPHRSRKSRVCSLSVANYVLNGSFAHSLARSVSTLVAKAALCYPWPRMLQITVSWWHRLYHGR